MKAKYETFMKFKYFKMMVEKETGQEIGILRTDRRGEFMSHEFKTFCNEQGICRQLTQALIPEQNGVAERRNRTIVEQAHSMISRCKLPTYLWNEAINTANFLVNGSPTSANQGETPERRYIMQKPDVSFLRVFGCFSYLHVPKKNRSKLESKTQKCLIMGYDSNSKAY
jgi:transposase InsO family protein